MKFFLFDESRFALLIIAALIQFASTIPTEAEDDKLPRGRRSEEAPEEDSGVAETRSHFATIALPPVHRHRYDRQPQPSDRSFRFAQGPRYVPHSGHKTLRRYNVPPPNYRISHYPNHPSEPVPYTHVPQREANRNYDGHYLREYPSGHQQQQQGIQSPPQPVFTPHAQVKDLLSFREPPSRLKAPEEGQTLRHYNIGYQLSTQAFPDYSGENYHEEKTEDNTGFRVSDDKNNETKPYLPYYDDYVGDGFHEYEEYVETSPENTPIHSEHDVPVDVRDHDSSSIFSHRGRKDQERKETPTTRSPENRPKNLASLLAGLTGLKTIDQPRENWSSNTEKHPPSTVATTPVDFSSPKLNQTDDSEYYYDDLYDEFVDMYFDSKNKTINVENTTRKPEEGLTKETKGNWWETSSKSLTSLTTVENPLTTSPTWKETTTSSPLGLTLAKKLTTLLKSTLSAPETERPGRTSPPISLSEIIEELGMNLPQFLGTLKTHGTSLKDFTAKLQTKSLSKSEFRRAKGNVKKLLEILESIPGKENTNDSLNVKESSSTSTTLKTTLTTPKTTKLSSSGISPTTTISNITPKSSRPLIFGSGSGGNPFLNTKSKNVETSKSISNNSVEALENTTLKPPLSIDLDISHILNEKGISPADIFQDFDKMFNISETSTIPPDFDKKTTISLRPYQTGAERNRPYRPYDFDRGNPNIHRGIINSRLSSTSRPTLRPPYSPKPPSISYGESEEENQANVEFVNNQGETVNKNLDNDDKSSSNKKKNYNQFNYNIVKSSPENLDVSTRSAIMAAGILGGVALSVFIAIFIVVKYRNHMHRNRRRIPLTLPSDSSSSSLPPIYASRNVFGKEAYETSGFWTTLKKRFDPYSTSSSPTSM